MSVVLGHVGDIGEIVKAIIPFERVSTTMYPNRCGIPNEIMEEGMAVRKRTTLELAFPSAAGIDIGSASHFIAAQALRLSAAALHKSQSQHSEPTFVDWRLGWIAPKPSRQRHTSLRA